MLLTVGLAALVAYASFPSQQRHWDGAIQDAASVTQGRVDPAARHFLYTLVGVPYFEVWKALGYPGDATWPLQVLNAVLGATGVVILAASLWQITNNLPVSAYVSLAFGFSYGYWYFLADTWYNVLGIALVALAGWLLLRHMGVGFRTRRPSPSRGVRSVLSVLSISAAITLAIMTSQEHVVSALALGIGLLLLPLSGTNTSARHPLPATGYGRGRRQRLVDAAIYAAGTGFFTGMAYLLFAWWAAGVRSLSDMAAWLVSYAPVQPTSYMSFDARHFTRGLLSFVSTLVPSSRGLGLRRLLAGSPDAAKLLPQLALLLTLGMASLLAVAAIRNRRQIWRRHGPLVLTAVLWFLLCAVFAIWSDPFGPERWLVAIIPLAYLAAIVLDSLYVTAARAWRTAARWLSVGVVLTLFLANLTAAIALDHRLPNPLLEQATCCSRRMTSDDVIISPSWDFTRYLDFLAPHLEYVQLMHLSASEIGRTPDRMQFRSVVDDLIRQARAGGGRAYLVDVFGYDAGEWQMVEWNTGLVPADFERYHRQLAWTCEGARVWEIDLPDEVFSGPSPFRGGTD
jgi:hypothetical protein